MSASNSANPIKFYDRDAEYNFLANTARDFPIEFHAEGKSYKMKGGSEGVFQGSRLFVHKKEHPTTEYISVDRELQTLSAIEGADQQSYTKEKDTSGNRVTDASGTPVLKRLFQSNAFDNPSTSNLTHKYDKKGNRIQETNNNPDNKWTLKESIMYECLLMKATQHPEVLRSLLATGNKPIVEDTSQQTKYNDHYWGNGKDGNGRNALGRLWMMARDTLQEEMKSGQVKVRIGFSQGLAAELGITSTEFDKEKVIRQATFHAVKTSALTKAEHGNMSASKGALKHTRLVTTQPISQQIPPPPPPPLPTTPFPAVVGTGVGSPKKGISPDIKAMQDKLKQSGSPMFRDNTPSPQVPKLHNTGDSTKKTLQKATPHVASTVQPTQTVVPSGVQSQPHHSPQYNAGYNPGKHSVFSPTAEGNFYNAVRTLPAAQVNNLEEAKTIQMLASELVASVKSKAPIIPVPTGLFTSEQGPNKWEVNPRLSPQEKAMINGPIFMARFNANGQVKDTSGNPVYDILYYEKGELKPEKSFIAPDNVPPGSISTIGQNTKNLCHQYHKAKCLAQNIGSGLGDSITSVSAQSTTPPPAALSVTRDLSRY